MAYGAFVQSKSVSSGSGTSAALAFNSNNTAGNTLVVSARIGGTTQSPGISDSQGNTWAVAVENYELDGNTHVLWYCSSCKSGANTVTITNTDSVTRRWGIAEYEGASLLDQHTHGSGASTAADSGGVVTTVAAELIVGSLTCSSGAGAITAGTDFTLREAVEQKWGADDRVVSSTGTYSALFSIASPGDSWGCIVATFSQVVAAAAATSQYTGRANERARRGMMMRRFAQAKIAAGVSGTAGTTYTVSISDNIAIQDSTGFARLSNASRIYSDNLAFTETWVRRSDASRVYSDNLAISEVYSRKANAARIYSDNLGVTEVYARIANAKRLVTDSIGMRVDYDAIRFDATSTSGYKASQSSYSWSHVNAGDFLEVDIELFDNTTSVSGVTFNSVSMTNIGTRLGSTARVSVWGLVAPSVGTFSIAVTLSTSANSVSNGNSYIGVDQQVPTEGFTSDTSPGGNPSVGITTTISSSWIIASSAVTSDTFTGAGASQSIRENTAGAAGAGIVSDYIAATTGPYTQLFTTTNGGSAVITAFVIRPQPAFWRLANANRLISDNVVFNEAFTRKANASRVYTDSLSFNETFARLSNASRVYSDNIGLNETFARLANAKRSVSDSIVFTETFSRLANALRIFSDNIGITEVVLALLAGARIIRIADNIGLTETFDRLSNASRVYTESLGVSDSVFRQADAYRALSDSFGLAESLTRQANSYRLVVDNISTQETFARVASALRLVQDNVGLSEVFGRIAHAFRQFTDSLGVVDSATASVIIYVTFVPGNKNVWFAEARGLTWRGDQRTFSWEQPARSNTWHLTDEASGPVETLSLYTSESRLLYFDFSKYPEITDLGDTLLTPTVTADSGSVTIGAATVVGNAVKFRVTAPATIGNFTLTCTSTTTLGNLLEGLGHLTVSVGQTAIFLPLYTTGPPTNFGESRLGYIDFSALPEIADGSDTIASATITPDVSLLFSIGTPTTDGEIVTARYTLAGNTGTVNLTCVATMTSGSVIKGFAGLVLTDQSISPATLVKYSGESRVYDFDISEMPEFATSRTVNMITQLVSDPTIVGFLPVIGGSDGHFRVRLPETLSQTTYALTMFSVLDTGVVNVADILFSFGRLVVESTSVLAPTLSEYAAESRLFDFGFETAEEIAAGAVIVSLTSLSGISPSSTALSDNRVQIRVSGQAVALYATVCTITTDGGDILQDFGKLYVAANS